MAERLLTEHGVCDKLGWPCRAYIDARMRRDGFPRPHRKAAVIGDQWRESDVDDWISGAPSKRRRAVRTLEEALAE